MHGKTVNGGSTIGSAGGTFIENYNKTLPAGTPKINVVYSKSTKEETLAKLRNGSLDVIGTTKSALREYQAQYGDVLKQIGLWRESYAYVLFNKKQTQLKKDFDAALHELITSGKLSEIAKRTIGFDYKDF